MTDERVSLTPIKRYQSDGDEYEYRYRCGSVHLDDLDEDVECDWDAEVELTDEGLWWRYEGKPDVLVTEDGAECEKGVSITDAEHQAYFALSWLEEQGLVSGFKKV